MGSVQCLGMTLAVVMQTLVFFRTDGATEPNAVRQVASLVLLHFCRAFSSWVSSTIHMQSFLVSVSRRTCVAHWHAGSVL